MSDYEHEHERDYQRIKELLKSLPLEERLKLIQSDLSEHGLTIVISGSSCTSAHICLNITNSKDLDLGDVLESLAGWLRKTKKL